MCLRWVPGLKHTWCELPGLCNQADRSEQGRVTWEPNHDGRRTEDKPFRTQIGPGTPLPICPTKPGSPGAPIKHSREKHQWSKAQSRYMMCSCWIRSVSSEQQLMCVKDKDRTPYIKPERFLRRHCSLACIVMGYVAMISIQGKDSPASTYTWNQMLIELAQRVLTFWWGLDRQRRCGKDSTHTHRCPPRSGGLKIPSDNHSC